MGRGKEYEIRLFLQLSFIDTRILMRYPRDMVAPMTLDKTHTIYKLSMYPTWKSKNKDRCLGGNSECVLFLCIHANQKWVMELQALIP